MIVVEFYKPAAAMIETPEGDQRLVTLRIAMFPLVCLAAMVLLGLQASSHAAEVVHFNSAVLPPSPLKQRLAKAQGKELKQQPGFPIWGHLSKPDGTGPFPALVLMHGCAGIFPTHTRWASLLTELGYLTVILDSLRPRSVFDVCKDPMGIASPHKRALDAHGALAYLQGLPYVDSGRIGVIGWSHGGSSALVAVDDIGIAAWLPQRFKAAIAIYPYCFGARAFDLPILILLGAADKWAPLKRCQEMKALNSGDETKLELVAYPGVFHSFDVIELEQGRWIEGMRGNTYWLLYDAEAHRDAVERVKSFLAEHLK